MSRSSASLPTPRSRICTCRIRPRCFSRSASGPAAWRGRSCRCVRPAIPMRSSPRFARAWRPSDIKRSKASIARRSTSTSPSRASGSRRCWARCLRPWPWPSWRSAATGCSRIGSRGARVSWACAWRSARRQEICGAGSFVRARDSPSPGILVGLPAALVAGRLANASALLFGLSAHDPLVFVCATGLVVLAAVSAVAGPAARAFRLDPVTALRSE